MESFQSLNPLYEDPDPDSKPAGLGPIPTFKSFSPTHSLSRPGPQRAKEVAVRKTSKGRTCALILAGITTLLAVLAFFAICMVLVFRAPQSSAGVDALRQEVESLKQMMEQAESFQQMQSQLNSTVQVVIREMQLQLSSSTQNLEAKIEDAIERQNKSLTTGLTILATDIQDLKADISNSTDDLERKIVAELRKQNESLSNLAMDTGDLRSQLSNSTDNLKATVLAELQKQNQSLSSLAMDTDDLRSQLSNSTDNLKATVLAELQKQNQSLSSLAMDFEDFQSARYEFEKAITCELPTGPVNGTIELEPGVEEYGLGSVATYYCDPGYALVGQTTRTCEDTNGGTVTMGTWSGEPPICQEILCEDLLAPSNGDLLLSAPYPQLNTTATYSCNPGYVLMGDAERRCYQYSNYTGLWAGNQPICVSNASIINCHNTQCRQELLVCSQQDHCNIDCYDSRSHPCFQTSMYCPTEGECTLNCDGSYACLQATTTCSPGGDCTVNCRDDYTCLNIDVSCYGNDCHVNCLGEDSCISSTIDCPSGNCTLNCMKHGTCNDVTLTCPSNGDYCKVNCSRFGSTSQYQPQPYTCQNSHFTCPSSGNCEFSFGGYYTGYEAEIICADDSTCVVYCNDHGSDYYQGRRPCYRSRITCTDSNECIVHCSGTDSCDYLNLVCGPTKDCLTCSGYSSCDYATITLPTVDDATLSCTGQYSCRYGSITCSDNFDCGVHCTDSYACERATINCPTAGDCLVNCTSVYSCRYSTITCPSSYPSCLVNCAGEYSCRGSGSAYIMQTSTLHCTGPYSCQSARITCLPNTNCTILCGGLHSCDSATVICPTGDYSCNIHCDPLSCSDLSITNTDNLYLQCCGGLACEGVSIAPSSTECSFIERD